MVIPGKKSGERLQDQWSSGLNLLSKCSAIILSRVTSDAILDTANQVGKFSDELKPQRYGKF